VAWEQYIEANGAVVSKISKNVNIEARGAAA
jgi:hypothetical protein